MKEPTRQAREGKQVWLCAVCKSWWLDYSSAVECSFSHREQKAYAHHYEEPEDE